MESDLIFRFVFLLVLVSVFSISAYYRRIARQTGDVIERRAEGRAILVLRIVGGLPLLASLLGYIIYPRLLDWSRLSLPTWFRYVGMLIALLCIPFSLWVFRSIGRNISETVLTKSDHQLVTRGPYRWIRHPLYTTALVMLLSFSVIANNWFILVYTIALILIFRFVVIPTEEDKLLQKFGGAYKEYQSQTGAMFPKLIL